MYRRDWDECQVDGPKAPFRCAKGFRHIGGIASEVDTMSAVLDDITCVAGEHPAAISGITPTKVAYGHGGDAQTIDFDALPGGKFRGQRARARYINRTALGHE